MTAKTRAGKAADYNRSSRRLRNNSDVETQSYKPGDRVPASGIYRVEHGPHRLMHLATLIVSTRFPTCKECSRAVRFYLVRTVKTSQILPFRSNTLLEEYKSTGPQLARTG